MNTSGKCTLLSVIKEAASKIDLKNNIIDYNIKYNNIINFLSITYCTSPEEDEFSPRIVLSFRCLLTLTCAASSFFQHKHNSLYLVPFTFLTTSTCSSRFFSLRGECSLCIRWEAIFPECKDLYQHGMI